jgi:hypothetical protein
MIVYGKRGDKWVLVQANSGADRLAVNQSAGPLVDACVPTRLIFMFSLSTP